MMEDNEKRSMRESLILAGIEEIQRHGIQNFSIRRVANACEVSCAAPYKHFRDKQELIAAVIEYVYARWGEQRTRLAEENAGSTREKLTKISVGYVRFLHENPSFRSIIMLRDAGSEAGEGQMLLRLTDGSHDLIEQYCREVGMPPDVQQRKTFVVRSLIYGAALMLDNGDLPNNEHTFAMIESMIGREFDLP